MLIPVSSILQATNPITRYDFNESIPLPDEGEQLLEPVKGELQITRVSDENLRLTGDFQTRLHLVCDRCNEPYELPHRFSLDDELAITHEPITAEEVEERVAATGSLDATDLIRQHMLLSLPARKLCGCEPKVTKQDTDAIDPRWAALRSFPETNGKH